MIITFCGHAHYRKSEADEHQILAFLEEKIGNKDADIYLGGYGGFDEFAYDCCKKYQKTHPNISLIFITPYMTVEYQRTNLKFLEKKYDAIIYPEIENKPKRYAIQGYKTELPGICPRQEGNDGYNRESNSSRIPKNGNEPQKWEAGNCRRCNH